MSNTIKFFFLGIIALTKNDLFASDIQNTDQENFSSQNEEKKLITLLKKYTEIGKNFNEEEKKQEYEKYKNQYLEDSKNNNNKEYYKLHNKTSEENKDVQTNNDIKNEKIQNNNEIKNENKQEKPHNYDFYDNEKKIKLDVDRTLHYVPDSKRDEMRNKLRNVLNSLFFYKEKIEYLQGFHEIVGAMLLYCEEEYVAFWFFIALYKEKGLEKVYRQDLSPQTLEYHCKKVKEYPKIQKIHKEINNFDTFFEFFYKPSFLCKSFFLLYLDCITKKQFIPYILENFLKEGFVFIYKMCIAEIQNVFSENFSSEKADEVIEKFKEEREKENFLEKIINKIKNDEKSFLQKYFGFCTHLC